MSNQKDISQDFLIAMIQRNPPPHRALTENLRSSLESRLQDSLLFHVDLLQSEVNHVFLCLIRRCVETGDVQQSCQRSVAHDNTTCSSPAEYPNRKLDFFTTGPQKRVRTRRACRTSRVSVGSSSQKVPAGYAEDINHTLG